MVYRTSFNAKKNTDDVHLDQDVTREYVLTVDVDIENIFNINAEVPILTVFDKREGWYPVVQGEKTYAKFKFNNIGYNVVYLPMDKESEKTFNYPFFIDAFKNIRFFKPDKNVLDSAVLTRKIGLSIRRYREKLSWMKALNGSVIKAANTSKFNNAKVLHEVSNLNSTHIQKIKITDKTKYKYVIFNSKKTKSFLAKLALYDLHMKPLKGEDYELFYWDKQWKSLGKQKAQDTLLHYNNVPKNALLWLRNLTKGREEHVFCIDENKKQHWLDFENL